MNTRRMTLLLAILLAVGTGWLTLNYINNVKRSTLANNVPRTVVVAVADIPARTTITANMLQQTSLPGQVVERDALAEPSQAVGSLSLITIPAGSQLTASKVGHPQDVGLPVRLAPGKRAVSIQIDKVKGISGMIQPGDRVDIIAIPPRTGNRLPPGRAILRNVLILAVGATLETTGASPSPDAGNYVTATVGVTTEQADLLASADMNVSLRLALRPPGEVVAELSPRHQSSVPRKQDQSPSPPLLQYFRKWTVASNRKSPGPADPATPAPCRSGGAGGSVHPAPSSR